MVLVDPTLVQNYINGQLHDATAPFLSKSNIFLFDKQKIEQGIVTAFPRIQVAQISREAPLSTTIIVTVNERQPLALWCADVAETDCYQMDNTGFIFATATAPPVAFVDASSTGAKPVPVATGEFVFEGGLAGSLTVSSSTNPTSGDASTTVPIPGTAGKSPISQTFAGAHVAGMYSLLQMLANAGFMSTSAHVESSQDFWVYLERGYYLKASFGEDPSQLVRNLNLVLSSSALTGKQDQIEYIDLRFGDRVYYKLVGQAESPSTSQKQP